MEDVYTRLHRIANDPNYSDDYVGGVCREVLAGEMVPRIAELEAKVVKLKADLVRSNTELGRVKDLVDEFCNDPIWDRL